MEAVIGLTSLEAAEMYLGVTFEVPNLGKFEPLVKNVALQLFTYHVANSKRRAIDKVRNLAKIVTARWPRKSRRRRPTAQMEGHGFTSPL